MPIIVHTDALGSIMSEPALIFVFTLYSPNLHQNPAHSPVLSLDFFLLQLSLFIFLTGYSAYAVLHP